MAPLNLALKLAIGLLMIDSIIELSFISSMVSWLHRRAGRDFQISYNNSTFPLHGKPANLLLNEGHTSNGAAGTAFVLIGLGGILALYLRHHASRPNAKLRSLSQAWYHFWLIMTIPSTLLTLAALIYTFVLVNAHQNQTINLELASQLNNHPYPNYVAYPLEKWTPQNWFQAVLQLPLANSSDRRNIESHVRVMEGWKWNLIPMFVIGFSVSGIAFAEAMAYRRLRNRTPGFDPEHKRVAIK
ncbi:uncharacterized protein MYCFIDRAFT_210690 [Pseudocercospora fijiensis CIRAD86]|uniref:Uncharacterized protein n=1 Tax=Pseudocercospora fijiensis (strain CIRAD86) TaxID=383855 RepID=M2ZB61_PSEFD|nr:uncharacterized protein MYCFIDRAFT_210690 [Pseudocercospora fijiensis CIRAD86]EME87095.1 hypothetical protein MYCFIDRAFT_210690 [Pseudocercospora fijiensis CIRAD86]